MSLKIFRLLPKNEPIAEKMATKGKKTGENIGEQQQQQQQEPSMAERDKVKAEREARRKAKIASKQKLQDKSRDLPVGTDDGEKRKVESTSGAGSSKVGKSSAEAVPSQAPPTQAPTANATTPSPKVDSKSSAKRSNRKEQTHAKDASQRPNDALDADKIANELVNMKINDESKIPPVQPVSGVNFVKPEKKQLTKAERRAIQEAQRAAKAAKPAEKKTTTTAPASGKKSTDESKVSSAGEKSRPSRPKESSPPKSSGKNAAAAAKTVASKKSHQHRVKLFNHLYSDSTPSTLLNSTVVHPAIVRLGEQYAGGIVKGCNARGVAFMGAIKAVIAEYETPSQKEFGRSLEDVIKTCGNFLQQCRPLAVSVTNAMKFIQFQLRQLPKTEADAKVCVYKIYVYFSIEGTE